MLRKEIEKLPEIHAIVELTEELEKLCDKVMRKRGGPNKRGVYWWTTEIAQQRKVCVAARRVISRSRRRREEVATINELVQEWKAQKGFLKKLIGASKQDGKVERVDGGKKNEAGSADYLG